MPRIPLDETEYTTALALSLNSYVEKVTGRSLPSPYTPHTRRQSFKNLDRANCFDLIQKLSESSLLILEVKVTHDGKKLHSFNKQQRIVDAALRESGIPLEYCYNTVDDYVEKNSPLYTLDNTLSSHPTTVADDKGVITDATTHEVLRRVVDRLLNADEGNAGAIGALFNKNLIKSMRELNVKALFFANHAGDLSLMSEADLYAIYESYSAHVKIAGGVDLKTATQSDLEKEFTRNAQQLIDVLEEWQRENALTTQAHRRSSPGLSM